MEPKKAAKKEELKVMKSLHTELNKNLGRFDEAYKFHLNRKLSIETIMSIEPRAFSIDSLRLLIVGVNENYTFDPFQGIYNSLINSGKIELISNDSLKDKISMFQDLIMDFKEEEDNTMNFTTQDLYPFLLSEATLDNFYLIHVNGIITKEEELRAKEKYVKLIESDIYEAHLDFLSGWMKSIFEEGPILKEEMVSIINLLESEIETYN